MASEHGSKMLHVASEKGTVMVSAAASASAAAAAASAAAAAASAQAGGRILTSAAASAAASAAQARRALQRAEQGSQDTSSGIEIGLSASFAFPKTPSFSLPRSFSFTRALSNDDSLADADMDSSPAGVRPVYSFFESRFSISFSLFPAHLLCQGGVQFL